MLIVVALLFVGSARSNSFIQNACGQFGTTPNSAIAYMTSTMHDRNRALPKGRRTGDE